MAASYGAPGVYIEEQPSGSMPIEGVGTAVAAFVGFTERYDTEQGDPTDPAGVKPQLVTSWPQYERIYGGFVRGAMLPHAVRGYFENGGGKAYICRIPTTEGESANGGRPTLTLPTADKPDTPSLQLSAVEPGRNLEVEVVPPAPAPPQEGEGGEGASHNGSGDYTLRVYEGGALREELGGLQFSGRSTRTVEKTVNERSKFVRIEMQPLQGASLAERTPAPGRYTLEVPPVSSKSVTPADLVGSESDRTGYQGLAIAENVTMVAIPDLVTVATRDDGSIDEEMFLGAQKQLIDFCEASHNKMAILDTPPGLNATRALEWRARLARDSAFGALYYPNVVVSNPLARPGATNGELSLVVPGAGHVAGVWARTDAARGVWKAPANEALRGIVRLETEITSGEQDLLNPDGVNCIRSFGSYGTKIWGARTLAKTDPSWRYINVRRLFNFVEESIQRGTQWAVFEPNDYDLWQRVKRTITSFLRGLWMQGALVGATPEQAFYVHCDESNNPPSSVDEGKLIVEIGIAPVKPAEFVIFRISQWQGGGAASE
ncbi:phage tail sheath subtilisin-like domain-containing protein [Actinoplanes sp. KI2]|uniref:phage tail sheath family protein n=1 Tax=Actinoplanes sp. KI2 TaxID=2983315 RepID=UPI0021D5CB1E|nr:phage tail sheath C-terminal domain-containing protein [Actinoplanes sp. KI2]MCU7727323.1 phage tail sheath subtilisin-like domain-containing protein [Actinoplanes sp. KI2]